MSSIQKIRTYVYDTPATYNQFNGGINTNLSNEDLEQNELRDGLNCHYVNQSLMNRKGEKVINKLILPINSKPQGDFLFSGEHNDYIISVRNGHIYWSYYDPTVMNIPMTLLPIEFVKTNERDDCRNYFIDIKERTEDHDLTEDTEGYILHYLNDTNTPSDYVPTARELRETLVCQNKRRVQGIPVKLNLNPNDSIEIEYPNEEHTYFILATGTRVIRLEEAQYIKTNDDVFDDSKNYYYYNYRKQKYIALEKGTDYTSETTFGDIYNGTDYDIGDEISSYINTNHKQVYQIRSTTDTTFNSSKDYYKYISAGTFSKLIPGVDYVVDSDIATYESTYNKKVYDSDTPDYIKANGTFKAIVNYTTSNGTLVDYFEASKKYIQLTAGTHYTVGDNIKVYCSKTQRTVYRIENNKYIIPDEQVFLSDKTYYYYWSPIVLEYLGNDTYTLMSHVMDAYKPNSWEYQNIGINNFSPFPNYYIDETSNVPKTSIGTIVTEPKQIAYNVPSIKATVKVNSLVNWSKSDFYYKWEAKFGSASNWVTIHAWDASINQSMYKKSQSDTSSKNKTSIEITADMLNAINGGHAPTVDDVLYIRCTLTSDFQYTWNMEDEVYYKDVGEDEYYLKKVLTTEDDVTTESWSLETTNDFVADQSIAQYSKTHITRTILSRYEPNNTTEGPHIPEYWDSHAKRYLTIGEHDAPADNQFLRMHSCTKIVSDGEKILLYDDEYDTCEWYKSVIGQPNYLSYGGNLNFKTTKDEKLIGVVVFDGNIIVYADNTKLGGNISVVTGNGDDYNDGDYYSPYKRKIVNTHVSCDSYNSIQVFENNIIFKYRDDIYLLDTNDLDNERVEVITINDKVKTKLNNIEFPLNRIRFPYENELSSLNADFYEYNKCLKPDEIFSEVYDGYYGIIFPHQAFHMDTFEYPENALKNYEGDNKEYIERLRGRKIENVSVKQGLKWKCYLRNAQVYQNESKQFYPWLRDVSKYLNIVGTLLINGISTLVTENAELVQFNNDDYEGINEHDYKVRIATKCYDMELPTLCKFMDNLNVYYNRDFLDVLDADMYVKNESGFYIYSPDAEAYVNMQSQPIGEVEYDERYKVDDALCMPENKLPLDQYDEIPYIDPIDKPVQILDQNPLDDTVLTRPNFTSITLTPKYRFPFLSAQFIAEIKSNQAFALSSLTFSFTSHDMPDFTREKLYRDIIKDNILMRW